MSFRAFGLRAMLALTLFSGWCRALAQDPAPALVPGSLRKVSDAKGTTFYATWIANNAAGGVRPEFIYTVAGGQEQSVSAKPAPIKGTRPVKVSARVLGLTRTKAFEWRAFAGGGANDQDSTTFPDKGPNLGNPLPGVASAAIPAPGIFRGIVADPNGAQFGYGQAQLTGTGLVSAKFYLFGQSYSYRGTLGDDGQLTLTKTPQEGPSIEATFVGNAVTNRLEVTLRVASVNFPDPLTAVLAPSNPAYSTKNPAPQTGRYTLLLPIDPANSGDVQVPQGEGSAAMVVSPDGSVKIVGKLADGVTLRASSVIDEEGGLAFFVPLYGVASPGFLTGKIDFATVAGVSDAAGRLTWSKPGPAFLPRPYDAGFQTDIFAIASRYGGVTETHLLYLYSPDLSKVLTRSVNTSTVSGSVPVFPSGVASDLVLKLDAKTGVLTGTLVPAGLDAGLGKRPVHGVVFPAQNRLGGFYTGLNGVSGLISTIDLSDDPVFSASGLPLPIPDNDPVGTTSTLSIPQSGTIASCTLALDIAHFFIGDLKITLTSPAGTATLVHNRAGSGQDNLRIEFPIPAVTGENAGGVWTLKVSDEAASDAGVLVAWSLKMLAE